MPAGSGPSAGLRPGEVRSAVTEALAAWCALPLPGESVDGVTGTAGTACAPPPPRGESVDGDRDVGVARAPPRATSVSTAPARSRRGPCGSRTRCRPCRRSRADPRPGVGALIRVGLADSGRGTGRAPATGAGEGTPGRVPAETWTPPRREGAGGAGTTRGLPHGWIPPRRSTARAASTPLNPRDRRVTAEIVT